MEQTGLTLDGYEVKELIQSRDLLKAHQTLQRRILADPVNNWSLDAKHVLLALEDALDQRALVRLALGS